jgi:hypothetical protein
MPRMEIGFVPNVGQFDPSVSFAARTSAGSVFVTKNGQIVYPLRATRHSDRGTASVREAFVGGRARPRGGRRSATRVSYFVGRDPSKWRTGVPTYRDLDLGEVYPGIRIRLVARSEGVEKVMTVAPGASLDAVQICVDGARRLRRRAEGTLAVAFEGGSAELSAPIAYQPGGGTSGRVRVLYSVIGRCQYKFLAGRYDTRRPLVVDPILQASYFGGESSDIANAVAVASNGDVLMAGSSGAPALPYFSNGEQSAPGSFLDGFVARFSGDLKTLREATYFGGDGDDEIMAIAVASDGDIVVGGWTRSTDLPGTAGGAQSASLDPGALDGFFARFSGDLAQLRQSTYFGGDEIDRVLTLALASNQEVVAGGVSMSLNLPGIAGGEPPGPDSGDNAFVTRLAGNLKSVVRTTSIGGTGRDQINAISLASNGDIVVAGWTDSLNVPHTSGALQESTGGRLDGFVARLRPDLKSVVRATYLGGAEDDVATAVTVASNGEILVAGATESDDFPDTAGGAQPTHALFTDGFVARVSGDLTEVLQATYFGGDGSDGFTAIAWAGNGDLLAAGGAASDGLPATAGAAQSEIGRFSDAVVARFHPDLKTTVQATFFGGDGLDYATSIATGGRSDVFLAGMSVSSDLPATDGGAQAGNAGGGDNEGSFYGDAFVARLTDNLRANGGRDSVVCPITASPSPGVSGRPNP